MDTHVISIFTYGILCCTALIARVLAWALTEVRQPLLPFKPFTCWGCLSFWFTLAFGITLALEMPGEYDCPETRIVEAYGIVCASVLLGLINYFWVKSKYQIYE